MQNFTSFNSDSFSSFNFDFASPLSKDVQKQISRSYVQLASMLAISSVACYYQMTYGSWILNSLAYVSGFGGLACMIAFYFTDETRNEPIAKSLLYLFAVFQGLSVVPLVELALDVNPSILFSALTSSALLFASLSAAVLYSPKPSQIYVTGMLMSAVSISFWLGLANIFFRSQMLFDINLWFGLGIFSMYVIYDTQIMIMKAQSGQKTYLKHAAELYIDFFQLFVRLLIILLKKDENDKKKRKDRN